MTNKRKPKKLREMSTDKLKERLNETKLELMKANGLRNQRGSIGHDQKWHPDFKEMQKTIARIKTILRERRGK